MMITGAGRRKRENMFLRVGTSRAKFWCLRQNHYRLGLWEYYLGTSIGTKYGVYGCSSDKIKKEGVAALVAINT